jgi:NADH:ubiquinone oxidoreductase subunit E
MSQEQNIIEHLDEVNKVVEEYLKGSDPTKISKELDIPRTRVVTLINEWKVMASANDAIRARAKEAMASMDAHYGKLITKAYEVIDEASLTNNLSAKTQAIKLVVDIEKSRIEMLQKAGLLENKELAEEMVEIEKRQEILVEILRDIATEHPEIRDKVMRRLSDIAKENEVITIVHDIQ